MGSSTSPTSPDSFPTEFTNPDPALSIELISTKTTTTHQLSLSTAPNTPVYTVEMHEPLSSKMPSILLHPGASKAGPAVGVVKLGSQRASFITIGIGNPEAILEDGDKSERMVWERLQRLENRSYRGYEIEFAGKLYTWRRTEDRWLKFIKDMELRAGKEEDGELIAAWKGSTRLNVKRGSFFLKKKDERFGAGECKRLEAMVLLTGLAIIEGYRRRAR